VVDRNARYKNAPDDPRRRRSFGQLQVLWVVAFSPDSPLKEAAGQTFVMAEIKSCKTYHDNSVKDLGITFFDKFGQIDCVDVRCIDGLVGRIPCGGGNSWAIIDRNGYMARKYESCDGEDGYHTDDLEYE
jgi:hypothetical protein